MLEGSLLNYIVYAADWGGGRSARKMNRHDAMNVPEEPADARGLPRRTVLRWGALGGAGVALATGQGLGVPFLDQKGFLSPDGAFAATAQVISDGGLYIENFPTSPLILSPFTDPLPVPKALRPEPQTLIASP